MRRWSSVAGVILIVLGVLAIFHIGWIFWPLVLIGVGVWFVMGFAGGGFSRDGRRSVTREQTALPLEGAAEAAITIRHGAGRLTMSGGAATDQLLTGSFGGGLDASRRTDGGKATVDMRVRDRDVSHYFFPWGRGWAGALDWDIALNQSIPFSLRLETGASESRLSLTDLKVQELSIKTGASSTTVDLPRAAGFTRVQVESGAAAVKLRVPQGVAASIQVKSALAGIHVDKSRFPLSAAGYASPDYAGAANKVEIFVETGVGSVDIY
jgi:hypothetical protein